MQFWKTLRVHIWALCMTEQAQDERGCITAPKWQPRLRLQSRLAFIIKSIIIPKSHLVLTIYFLNNEHICVWVTNILTLMEQFRNTTITEPQCFQALPFSKEKRKFLRKRTTYIKVYKVHSSCLHLKFENEQFRKPNLSYFVLGQSSAWQLKLAKNGLFKLQWQCQNKSPSYYAEHWLPASR